MSNGWSGYDALTPDWRNRYEPPSWYNSYRRPPPDYYRKKQSDGDGGWGKPVRRVQKALKKIFH